MAMNNSPSPHPAGSPQLTQAYSQQRLQLVSAVVAAATRVFARYAALQGEGVPALLKLVISAQRAMVTLVDGYLSMALGVTPQSPDAESYTIGTLRHADPAEVYAQPYAAMTIALMRGEDETAALASGVARVEKLVTTDLQLAQTHAARDFLVQESGAVGWLRIPDPGACEFCVMVSGQVYHTGDLMPIHEHCGCGVAPVDDTSTARVLRTNAILPVEQTPMGPRLLPPPKPKESNA